MGIYKSIKAQLSVKNQGRLIRLLYYSGLKPRINTGAISPFKKGIVVFSADFEMAWAFRYSKKRGHMAVEMGLRERNNFSTILGSFDKYNIPVTWATVGHLFLEHCHKDEKGVAHPDMPRPVHFENRNWLFDKGDWYQHDPCTDKKNAQAWYAPDLIEQILKSKTKHEIGSHTFSHIDCTYKNCSKELMDAELKKCVELGKAKGITMKSHVFPGGTFGNYESLKENGFTNYRKPFPNEIDLPIIDEHGLVRMPSSLGMDKDPYEWSASFHLGQFKKFLKRTVSSKQVCHFWFHPSMDPWYMEEVLPKLLKMVADERDKGTIEILTMGELAERVLKK